MGRPHAFDLTPAQIRIAKKIADSERKDRPVLVPDLLKSLRLSQEGALTPTLKRMEKKGFLKILSQGLQGRSRILQLTPKCRHRLGIGGLPILGYIPAGMPSEAIAQAEQVVELKELFPHQAHDFLLHVRGDSMIGDGILHGDIVLLRPNVEIPNKAIAAVCVGEDREGTLKRVIYEGKNVRLRAANPAFKDVVVPLDQVQFCGLLKGVIRNVGRP